MWDQLQRNVPVTVNKQGELDAAREVLVRTRVEAQTTLQMAEQQFALQQQRQYLLRLFLEPFLNPEPHHYLVVFLIF